MAAKGRTGKAGETARPAKADGTTPCADKLLEDVIDSIPAGFMLCDADDRIVVCNALFREWFFPGLEHELRPGARYEDVLRAFIDSGVSRNGREDADWLKTRLDFHRNPGEPFEHRLQDGRLLRTIEKRTRDGGVVSLHVDMTTLDAHRAKAAHLDVVLEAIDEGISVMDADLNCVASNARFLELLQFPPEFSVPGTPFESFIRYNAERGEYGEGDIETLVRDRVELARQFLPHCFERTRPDGSIIEVRGNPADGGGFVTTYTDITERRRAEEALTEQNERFNAALSNMTQGLTMFDKDRRLVVCNRQLLQLYDLPEHFAEPGTLHDDIIRFLIERGDYRGIDKETYLQDRIAMIAEAKPVTRILEFNNGRAVAVTFQPMANGGWVSTHEDITELQQAQARVAHMAHHDDLTNLPNRTLLRERMEQEIARLHRSKGFAVLCLDLDRFKNVNDAIGHPMGDKLLQAAAQRLRSCVRDTDTVARLGGDEFAILLVSDPSPETAKALAARICDVIAEPFTLHHHEVVVGASVGIALAPQDGSDPDQLMKNADMALYRAKNDGRGVYRFFEREMDARMQARRNLELDLRRALECGGFDLHYQPLVDLKTDTVTGFEALMRWQHPLRGNVPPGEFIPIAEEIGVIVPLGQWVIERACMDAVAWPSHLKVAVNLSPAQFRSETLVLNVFNALAKSGLAAYRLELEITETALLQNNAKTLETLHALRDMGVGIAMDDFGTGYSSLSYLRSFPFDKIKIDRSFIKDLSDRDDADVIVKAVANLSRDLGMKTTAEGVETEKQREIVAAAGYTEMQGFLFSPARPTSEIAELYFPDHVVKQSVA
ncbi:MAG: PAS-domain containing protein [Pseudomonadota bacterium]